MSKDPHAWLRGRTALISGASRGLGRAIALQLAGSGATTVLVARDVTQLRSLADAIEADGGRAHLVVCDLADPVELERLTHRHLPLVGPVDILINNAGIAGPAGALRHITLEAWTRNIDIGLRAAVALTLAVAPQMQDRRWGRVVNVSSGAAGSPELLSRLSAYAACKAALEAFTYSVAAELTDYAVTANVFRPGPLDTQMQQWVRDQGPDRLGPGLHSMYCSWAKESRLVDPDIAAKHLINRLRSRETGRTWTVPD